MTTATTYEVRKSSRATTVTTYYASAGTGFDEATDRVTVYGKEYALDSVWLAKSWNENNFAPTLQDRLTVTIGVYSLRSSGITGTKHEYKEVSFENLSSNTNLPADFITALGAEFVAAVEDAKAGA